MMSISLNQTFSSETRNYKRELAQCEIDTWLGSTEFMKKMIGPSIATVLNRRCQINPKYLVEHVLNEETYVGFCPKIPTDHCMFTLFCSKHHLKEIIEKKYIDEIILYIIEKESKNLQEVFVFTMKYNSGGDGKVRHGKVALNLAQQFFHSINQIPNESKYKEDGIIIEYGWKLNNTVPKTYLETDFKQADYNITQDVKLSMIGSLKTFYHKLNLLGGKENKLSTLKPLPVSKKPSIMDVSPPNTQIDEFFTAVEDIKNIFIEQQPATQSKRELQPKPSKGAKKQKITSTPVPKTPRGRTLRSNLKSTPAQCSSRLSVLEESYFDNFDDILQYSSTSNDSGNTIKSP